MSSSSSPQQGQDRIFYDGDCGLCHGAVRFVSKRLPSECTFRFAPLGGKTFQERVSPGEREGLPDSIVVQTSDGVILVRSAAAIFIMKRLGPFWRGLGRASSLVPSRVADGLYDFVARNRFRFFSQPDTSCPILSEELLECFDP